MSTVILNGHNVGMFDTIICDYPLPLPDEVKELKSPPAWDKIQFQTKSLSISEGPFGGFLDSYTIEDDGQIYKDVLERDYEVDEDGFSSVYERNNGIEKVDYTGNLVFYTDIQEEEYDYWVEFSALFWKGELKEIKLNEWKREDNSSRLEAHEKMMSALNKQKELKNSKSHAVKELAKSPIRFIFHIIKFLLGLLVRFVWWLERKLL